MVVRGCKGGDWWGARRVVGRALGVERASRLSRRSSQTSQFSDTLSKRQKPGSCPSIKE